MSIISIITTWLVRRGILRVKYGDIITTRIHPKEEVRIGEWPDGQVKDGNLGDFYLFFDKAGRPIGVVKRSGIKTHRRGYTRKICDCKGEGRRSSFTGSVRVNLKEGGHTTFWLLVCEKCEGFVFLPDENFKIFISGGDDKDLEWFESIRKYRSISDLKEKLGYNENV